MNAEFLVFSLHSADWITISQSVNPTDQLIVYYTYLSKKTNTLEKNFIKKN